MAKPSLEETDRDLFGKGSEMNFGGRKGRGRSGKRGKGRKARKGKGRY
jgi:hypothetical protein